jgi:glutaredoxin
VECLHADVVGNFKKLIKVCTNEIENYFLFIFVILLVLTACSKGPSTYDFFAQCLSEKGVKMYGTDWCSHCKNQKEMFGNSFQYITFIDCDWNKDECLSAGVEGYPTWIIDGENYPGEQSLNRLASLSGCKLIENEN